MLHVDVFGAVEFDILNVDNEILDSSVFWGMLGTLGSLYQMFFMSWVRCQLRLMTDLASGLNVAFWEN